MIDFPILARLYTLPLWEKFVDIAESWQVDLVKNLCSDAASLLENFIKTFTTYTLHNHIHSENVVMLTGKLLNENISNISALEALLLILSAYYHDIGMVFVKDDLNTIHEEPEFKDFLKANPEAAIKIHENDGKVSSEIMEWFCRSIHHKRVFRFLNNIKHDKFTDQIKKSLEYICESHGEAIDKLRR